MSSNEPVMNGCEVIHEIFHISLHKYNIIDKYSISGLAEAVLCNRLKPTKPLEYSVQQ